MDLLEGRPEKIIKWREKEIRIKALGKSGALSVAKNIANILKELGKEGWEFDDGKKSKESFLNALLEIIDRVENDIDRIILYSTDDVTREELEAGQTSSSDDFDLNLYLQIIEHIVILNTSQIPLILKKAVDIKKQVMLIFGEEESEEENPETEQKEEQAEMSKTGEGSRN